MLSKTSESQCGKLHVFEIVISKTSKSNICGKKPTSPHYLIFLHSVDQSPLCFYPVQTGPELQGVGGGGGGGALTESVKKHMNNKFN